MGEDEFDCAADLLGRRVSVARRVGAINCTIEGLCTGVVASVPGDGCEGVIEVDGPEWNGQGVTRYVFDLSVWSVENCSASHALLERHSCSGYNGSQKRQAPA